MLPRVGAESAGALSSLRELNRLKVLEVVRERGTVSRSQIATRTGLARSTVSTLVGDLQRAGLVVEREDVQAGRRRVRRQTAVAAVA